MGDGSSLSIKIRDVLQQLPESTVAALRHAVKEALSLDDEDPFYRLLQDALQMIEPPAPPAPPPRPLNPSRLFFKPLERFLIDEKPYQKTSGRIWRGALQPIWNWIENSIADDEIRLFRHRMSEMNSDDADQDMLENELLDSVLPKVRDALDRAKETPETRRRFAYYLGGEQHLQELEDIAAILTHRDIISSFSSTWPQRPSLQSSSDLNRVAKLFIKLAGIEPRLPYYAAVSLQNCLEQKTQLPLWAAACLGSDDVREVANSPFAALIETALGDASLNAEQCIAELKKPCEESQAIRFTQNYAMTCRNLRAAIDFEAQNSDWLRRLSETRLRISNALAEELGQIFQLMRRNVRPLRAFGKQTPYPPDEFDLARLCFLIDMLQSVRAYSPEFALNEIVNRVSTECDNYLQQATDALQDEIRSQYGPVRHIILAYVQAAIRTNEAWYGKDHALLLKRSFEAAASPVPKKAVS